MTKQIRSFYTTNVVDFLFWAAKVVLKMRFIAGKIKDSIGSWRLLLYPNAKTTNLLIDSKICNAI